MLLAAAAGSGCGASMLWQAAQSPHPRAAMRFVNKMCTRTSSAVLHYISASSRPPCSHLGYRDWLTPTIRRQCWSDLAQLSMWP